MGYICIYIYMVTPPHQNLRLAFFAGIYSKKPTFCCPAFSFYFSQTPPRLARTCWPAFFVWAVLRIHSHSSTVQYHLALAPFLLQFLNRIWTDCTFNHHKSIRSWFYSAVLGYNLVPCNSHARPYLLCKSHLVNDIFYLLFLLNATKCK